METKNAPAFNYAQFGAVGFFFYWMDHNPRAASLVVLTLAAAAALAAFCHNFTTF